MNYCAPIALVVIKRRRVIKGIHYKYVQIHMILIKFLCNDYVISVLISINESGIFNVLNVYIDMKTEFKIVVCFINFLPPGKRLCTHGSEFVCMCANFTIKFVLINSTFCVGSGVRLFQGRFVHTQQL